MANEEVKKILQDLLIEKMLVKNALKSFSKMMQITKQDYNKEVNDLLDKLEKLERLEREIQKK